MKFLTFASAIFFVGSIILIVSNFGQLKIENEGEIVLMKIERLPASCLGTKVSHFVTLSYKGVSFQKKIGGSFCDEHHVGELIKMRYLEGADLTLFPNESVVSNLIAFALIGVIGLIILIKQVTQK
jgi:hypothetical protein